MNQIDKDMANIRNYQSLAAAIVEVACADYIDALIIAEKGYLSEDAYKKEIYNYVVRYGAARYIYKGRYGWQRQREKANTKKCQHIVEMMDTDFKKKIAKRDADILEKFFRSKTFAIYMPNTDPDWFINLLKSRAKRGDRFKTTVWGRE